jgi:hypothetical protein
MRTIIESLLGIALVVVLAPLWLALGLFAVLFPSAASFPPEA